MGRSRIEVDDRDEAACGHISRSAAGLALISTDRIENLNCLSLYITLRGGIEYRKTIVQIRVSTPCRGTGTQT
jgi:hypothetical protein